MRAVRAVAWTVFEGGPDALWPHVASTAALSLGLAPLVRWTPDDPDALDASLRAATPWSGASRLTALGIDTSLAVEVQGGLSGLRVALRLHAPWAGDVRVRRRLERTLGAGVRLVDEVVVTPPRGVTLAAVLLPRVMLAGQQRLDVPLPVRQAPTVRTWTLVDANLAHADPVLAGLDDAVLRGPSNDTGGTPRSEP